ncbi:hypothetical protein BO94DRAFT_80801 [Aspergillus sclerotioniger CBS 115572]|uniref:Uncharacterized protein n=1 Tax=Aspergillus sclerotioniger CBS 115572 TaxID=1450535 RepID=A0A317WQ77_9EURO|nr:hypothetical protein BO94DRAFT_80801 [Aspergillus sclerotioniger CBS 115572]PWY86390.1 hypothetical protein BO94DRAFT_80801 [Aspergillus sclerotioniger CBS 115572]
MTVFCIPCCLHPPFVGSVAGLVLIDTLHRITKEALPRAKDPRDQLGRGGGRFPHSLWGQCSEIIPACSSPGLCAGAWLIDSSGPSTRARSSGLHDLPAAQTVIQLMPQVDYLQADAKWTHAGRMQVPLQMHRTTHVGVQPEESLGSIVDPSSSPLGVCD